MYPNHLLARALMVVVAMLHVVIAQAGAAEVNPVSVAKIWDKAPHNAFADLVRWNGRFYCTFREAEGHVKGDGRICVIASEDGDEWASVALLAEEGIDLRDPKISIMPDGRLMIVAGGSVYRDGKLVDERNEKDRPRPDHAIEAPQPEDAPSLGFAQCCDHLRSPP